MKDIDKKKNQLAHHVTLLRRHVSGLNESNAMLKTEVNELKEWFNTFDTFVGKCDKNGILYFCNEAPLKKACLTSEETFGRYFPDTKWWSHSKAERIKIIECLQRAKTGESSRIETTIRSGDGTPIPIIFNCTPISDGKGNVKYITVEGKTIVEEIQSRMELHEARENLEKRVGERAREIKYLKGFNENIIESSPIGIHVIDRNCVVIAWNLYFEVHTMIKKEDIIGKNLMDTIPGIVESGWDKKYREVLETGTPWEANRFKYARSLGTKIGESLYLNMKIFPLKEHGKIVGAITLIENVTEQKRAEDELEKKREQLFHAQKMKSLGTLVAGVAHEVNNPLNLILYNVPLLQKIWYDLEPILKEHGEKEPKRTFGGLSYDFLKENLDQLLADTKIAVNWVAKIMGDLKNFARLSNIIDREPIQINEAVKNAVRLAGSTLKESKIHLNLSLKNDLPLIEGNLHGIEQITLNLLLNAIQSIHHKRGVVEVFTGSNEKDGQIYIAVSDNGRGVNPSIINRIYEPFVTDKKSEGGSGLGLSISHDIVKTLKGEISFNSKKEGGTIFKVSFPPLREKKPAKILVVDDDKRIRELLKKAVTENRPYLVDEASNGLEASIKLGTFHPDLLVMDVVMPGMDGLEVCRAIKAEPALSNLDVLITTGFPSDPRVKEISQMGFTNIYYKPFKLEDFLQTIDTILKM